MRVFGKIRGQPRLLGMDTTEQDAALVYASLIAGGLALVPTDVGYGLLAMESSAVRRIYELKGRPLAKPCVTVADRWIFDEVSAPIDAEIRAWIDSVTRRTPLAVVTRLAPASRLLGSMSDYVRSQATQGGTIATFHNAGLIVSAVAELAYQDGRVVVGSSANTSGTGNNPSLRDVPEAMRRGVDLVVDGRVWYGTDAREATTILDLTTGRFQRKGVNFALIERSWRARQDDLAARRPVAALGRST
jgi:tRNA A37 threonylcarbamoyladenosine synthetase subunit TsaC/SUA5/YrdC